MQSHVISSHSSVSVDSDDEDFSGSAQKPSSSIKIPFSKTNLTSESMNAETAVQESGELLDIIEEDETPTNLDEKLESQAKIGPRTKRSESDLALSPCKAPEHEN